MRFSTADIRELYRRYEAGESSCDLAESLGCHSSTLRNRFHKLGLPVRDQSAMKVLEMSKLPADEIARRLSAAHEAARGRKASTGERERRATARQLNPATMTNTEALMAAQLRARGLDYVFQQAAGVYNIDFAVSGSVAVECFGGGWHNSGHHLDRHQARTTYLLDHGWHVVIVWVQKQHDSCASAIADVVGLVELSRRDPAALRQYRVIWANGDLVIALDSGAAEFPCKPSFEVHRDAANGRFYSTTAYTSQSQPG